MTRFALLLLLMALSVSAQTLLEWDRNVEPFVTGYRVYHGFASRHYTDVRDAGNWTQIEVQPVPCAVSHWFAVTAYTADGLESDFSEELEWVPKCPRPMPPLGVRITETNAPVTVNVFRSSDLLRWENIGYFIVHPTNGAEFYKAITP